MQQRSQRIIQLSEAQNHHCAYCGVVMVYELGQPNTVTRDHVIPRAAGGPGKDWRNMVAACDRCNFGKGDSDAWDFFEKVQGGKPVERFGLYDRLEWEKEQERKKQNKRRNQLAHLLTLSQTEQIAITIAALKKKLGL